MRNDINEYKVGFVILLFYYFYINIYHEYSGWDSAIMNQTSGNSSPGPSLLRERAAIHGNVNQVMWWNKCFLIGYVLMEAWLWTLLCSLKLIFVLFVFSLLYQIEEVIAQAQSTKGALLNQRSMFIEIRGKVKHLSDRFPVIRSVLGKILM